MKKVITITITLLSIIIINSCEKEDTPQSKVDKNGLTKEITDLVPQHILDEIKRLGMPINGGDNPPLLTQGQLLKAAYIAKPFILKSSNRPSDNSGATFSDFNVTFQQQNNDALTIKVDYQSGTESGSGLGSYIVGNDCKFSVFVEVNSSSSGSTSAKVVFVISGTLLPNGIENLYVSNFMIDNQGNPQGVWIENGKGRVFYDSDGFSELDGTNKTWYSSLPPCPCTYAEAQKLGETMCPSGKWSNCGDASNDFHYGASKEVRWLPFATGQAGQQCTYDATGRLITGGIAAGSPDKISPGACGFWSWLVSGTGTISTYQGHKINDIDTWKKIPCWQYLRDWPANNFCGTTNIVSGIDHMKTMIGNMTCEEATLLIRKAKETVPPLIDNDLKSFFIGKPSTLTNGQVKVRLQNWRDINMCSNYPTDPLCIVINKAIANLP